MNSLLRLTPRALFTPLLLLLALGSAAFAADRNARDIAIIDRILAGVKSGQTMVELGDVGMTPAQLQAIRDRLAGGDRSGSTNIVTSTGVAYKWPAGLVYFRFANDAAITAARKTAFRDAIAEWAAFASLTFTELPSPPAAPGQANYITVRNDFAIGGGFSSAVGMAGGEQFINIGNSAWNRGTITHEMGHALGLWHEQQREDRDIYVTILFGNIIAGNEGNFVKVPGGSTSIGGYDFQSVMHYARDTFANAPGVNTIEPTAFYSQFLNSMGSPTDRVLSQLDRAGIAAMYGNPASLPGAVVTNTKDSGAGSLRTAIYYGWDRSTDVSPTPTTIAFQIPTSDPGYNPGAGTFTIRPTALLVAPGDGTTIDGATQTTFTGNTNPNGPEIVINGSQIVAPDAFAPALRLRTTNCVVKDLVINGFNQWGIHIYGAQTTGNVVRGCYIGTNATGTAAVANAFPGIEISSGAHGNTIGGPTAAHRNVISGNAHNGLQITGAGADNNVVQGNFVGSNAAQSAALPNTFDGIEVSGGAKFNLIGGTGAGAGNVIAGNTLDGVRIRGVGTDSNSVQGNFIGTTAGVAPMANQSAGVRIFEGAKANVVGGTISGARNIISGNVAQGVIIHTAGSDNNSVLGNYVGLAPDGTQASPNNGAGIGIFDGAKNNTIGSTVAGNVISGNAREGVIIADAGSTGNVVLGNRIGTNPAGTAAIANNFSGVGIFSGAQSNAIGGTFNGARNLISGNNGEGVVISGPGSNANSVLGNFIGLDAAGAAKLGNGFNGVAIYGGAQANVIGGTSAVARNIISGNTGQGVLISNPGSNGNFVRGNFIGTNPAGTAALGNLQTGLAVWGGAQSNTVGGTAPGAGNVISGNANVGVYFSDAGTENNLVLGNLVGLNASGGAALANAAGGIAMYGGPKNNVIGGTTFGSRNVISGNTGDGIRMANAGTIGNTAQGNTIGFNPEGTAAMPNAGAGVSLFGGAQSNVIGGTAAGSANLIAGNTNDGVSMFDAATAGNAVLGNSIFSNGFRGIALYSSSNSSAPAPALSSAVFGPVGNPGGTTISGNLTSFPSTTFRIEFFASPVADPSGTGEGQYFLGAGVITTNGAGVFTFAAGLAASVPAGYIVSATATDTTGNSSMFSSNVTVTSTDSDVPKDGIPDAWTQLYFGHPTGQAGDQSRAGDDADGDGDTNLEELRAGTDPRNPASRFALTIARVSGDARLTLPTVSGKTYRVEFTGSLFPSDWRLFSDQLSGTGAPFQLTDPAALSLPARSYRASVVP